VIQRGLVVFVASILLASPVSAQVARAPVAATGAAANAAVAFDQVDIVALGPYASTPDDFGKEAAAVEALAAERAANPSAAPAMVLPSKNLTRYAYWHGRSRVERVLTHTIVITKPGEIDTLDTLKKTYRQTVSLPSPSDATNLFAFPMTGAAGAPKVPGTIDISLAMDGGTGHQASIAGHAARAYSLAFEVKASDPTGSCAQLGHILQLQGTIENDVLNRPEPVATAATPTFFTPESFTKLPFFDPAGCALHALTVRMTDLPDLIAFADFYLYRRIEITPAAASGIPVRPTVISERGNIRDLTDADAALFDVPSDYTLVP